MYGLCSCQALISTGQVDHKGEVLSPAAVMQLLAVRLNPPALSLRMQAQEQFVKSLALKDLHPSYHQITTELHLAETQRMQRISSQLSEVLRAYISVMRGYSISSCHPRYLVFFVNSETVSYSFSRTLLNGVLSVHFVGEMQQVGKSLYEVYNKDMLRWIPDNKAFCSYNMFYTDIGFTSPLPSFSP